jgi:hypothetical protein
MDFATRASAFQSVRLQAQEVLELRNTLDTTVPEIQQELTQALKDSGDIRVRASVGCCQYALDGLGHLLHPPRSKAKTEPEIRYVLSGALLAIPGLTLSDSWDPDPSTSPKGLLKTLIKTLKDGVPRNWRIAFQELADGQRNHDATDRIIEYLSWGGSDEQLVAELTNEQQSHIRQCQHALNRQLEDGLKAIENAVALGLLRERERAHYLEVIEKTRLKVASTKDFGAEEKKLAQINAEIEDSRKLLVESVRHRLEAEHISRESTEYSRIIAVLEKGDVHTANEYIDLASKGDQLPEALGAKDLFSTFFPTAALEIDSFLSDNQQSGSLLKRIESGKGLPGVDMRNVPGAQANKAVEMLEAWFALKKSKRTLSDQLQILFERLGFEVQNVSQTTAYPRAWVQLSVTPLNHRDQCPIPYFGSIANGRYRLLCIWDRPSEEEIINQVRSGRQGTPAIVLYFGRLTEQKRRNLAQLSRADHLSFLVLDELLLVFLCGLRSSRLPAFFQCSLPFTFVSPYTTTASNVPPEMFYGRTTERTQIMDPMGNRELV